MGRAMALLNALLSTTYRRLVLLNLALLLAVSSFRGDETELRRPPVHAYDWEDPTMAELKSIVDGIAAMSAEALSVQRQLRSEEGNVMAEALNASAARHLSLREPLPERLDAVFVNARGARLMDWRETNFTALRSRRIA
ncbi:MAG: hypothetical protein J6386_09925 [Candidatus Synoicihabitans palmerolidicus]|nr:hypothetical protein [Candidatus Synoicihabitans palmerolidicus]